MPRSGIKRTGEWFKLERILDMVAWRKHERALMRHILGNLGKLGERQIRQEIERGRFIRNAALTIALKGSNEPLKGKGTGALFQGITSEVIGHRKVFVGVLRGYAKYNVVLAIHEGFSIGVTDRMRNLFRVLWLKTKSPNSTKLTGRAADLWELYQGPWYPLKDSTKAITLPRRPFIERAFKRRELRKLAERMYKEMTGGLVSKVVREG